MLSRVTIETDLMRYGPEPEIGSEIEQKLTINRQGMVFFAGYNYERSGHFPAGRRIRKNIMPAYAAEILDKILEYKNKGERPFVTDCGTYSVTLIYEDGTVDGFHGVPGFGSCDGEITKLLRKYLEIDNLAGLDD